MAIVATNGSENGTYDVREHPDASSMGNLNWPPKEATDQRRKFFYRTAITNHNVLSAFKQAYDMEVQENTATRMTGRVIVSHAEFAEFAQLFYTDIEAIIPLQDTGALEDCLMIYIGQNAPERISAPEVLDAQYTRAAGIFNKREPAKKQADFFHIRQITDEERTTMIADFLELYRPFKWQQADVKKILGNPNNIIMAAFGTEGTLVGSVLAEVATIEIDRDGQLIPFQMAEVTEAATKKEFRSKGLYGVLSNSLLYVLADIADPNLVFGEVNLDAPGALITAARQGRIPAIYTAQTFNIPHAWRLNQHVAISEGGSPEEEIPGYNNLIPAWLTRKQLNEFVEI